MNVDRAIEDPGVVIGVKGDDQLVPREDAARPTHEGMQEAELDGRDLNPIAVEFDLHPVWIDHQSVGGQDRLVGADTTAPPELGSDARHQLARTERLHDVVVRSEVQAHDLVGVAAASGQQHDRDIAPVAQLSTYLQPVQTGQHHI